MRYTILTLTALGAILLAACVPSLHPLYTESDLVSDSLLVGIWTNESGSEVWEFSEAEGKSYELAYAKDRTPAHFEARLVRLNGRLFLDTYPDEKIENDFLELHLVPAHVFGRVWLAADTLRMSLLDGDWLRRLIDKGEVEIGHEDVDDALVLTASTEELQKLVRKYADDAEAFAEPEVLTRRR